MKALRSCRARPYKGFENEHVDIPAIPLPARYRQVPGLRSAGPEGAPGIPARLTVCSKHETVGRTNSSKITNLVSGLRRYGLPVLRHGGLSTEGGGAGRAPKHPANDPLRVRRGRRPRRRHRCHHRSRLPPCRLLHRPYRRRSRRSDQPEPHRRLHHPRGTGWP